jgi:hypothetical protein
MSGMVQQPGCRVNRLGCRMDGLAWPLGITPRVS